MPTRRRFGCLLLASLLAAPAVGTAQEAAAPAADPAAPAAQKPRPPRPARRRQTRQQRAAAEEAARRAAQPAPLDTEHRLEAAPVPNRDMEGPRAQQTDRTRLSPSVIHRRLPSQGMATEGSASIQEERLFFPAPGARLNVPFSY